MFSSAIWAAVVLYLLWRAEVLGKTWLSKKDPLNKIQYRELSEKLDSLQNQVNSLNIQREIN